MSDTFDRRKFLKDSAIKASSVGLLPIFEKEMKITKSYFEKPKPTIYTVPRIKFSVIGLNHGHINSMVTTTIAAGGEMVSFYSLEDSLAKDFLVKFPNTKRVSSPEEIYENNSIQLILCAAILNERASIGIKAMLHGKDFMSDKPGATTLEQLEEVKKVQKQTGRIYSILYSERFENRATTKATELVKSGAIGKVIQTIGLGPHRANFKTRADWFFDDKKFGGIITDIGSHQFDQFLHFTGSTKAEIVASQVGNLNHPQYPHFQDFGDAMLKGNGGMGYLRIDWFTPDSLKTWGDGRLTILGTDGFIEIRKYIDITKDDRGNHLFMSNHKETVYFDCNNEPLPYGNLFVDDVLNRTETAMSQDHCFLAMELALKAQKLAKRV
ncbi:MAG: Gfo/Idh/MocA family oxidoreductase [Bacteroidota bacterium]